MPPPAPRLVSTERPDADERWGRVIEILLNAAADDDQQHLADGERDTEPA